METGLNGLGIAFITLAWGVVTGLLIFCFRKIFTTEGFGGDED